MKAPSIVLIFFLLSMIVIFFGLGVLSTHYRHKDNQMMEKVVNDLTERSKGLEQEIRELRNVISEKDQQLQIAAKAVTAPEPEPDATNAPPAKAVQPQPFQAKAYVGNDYLGMAWVVPRNIREQESGEFVYEPVIWIDQKARKTFTQTNIVEREVVRNNTFNQTYQQPYWYGYPIWSQTTVPQPQPRPSLPPPPKLPSPGRLRDRVSAPMIGNGDPSTPMIR